eukprot:gene8638-585_t
MTTPNKLVFIQHKSSKDDAENIVLIHGMDSCKETWTEVIESEKLKDFNIFAVDLHGHGETPNQNDTFTTDQMVADIHGFVVEHSIPPFYVIGHSMGARVAIPYCAKYPKDVKGVIMEDMHLTPFPIPKKDPEELKQFKDVIESEDELFSQYKKYNYSEDSVKNWIKDERIKLRDGKYYCGIRPYVTFSAAKNLLGTNDAHDAFVQLAKENVKILVLQAGSGTPIKPESIEEMKSINPKITHITVKDSTHSIHKDKSHDEFISIVSNFVN